MTLMQSSPFDFWTGAPCSRGRFMLSGKRSNWLFEGNLKEHINLHRQSVKNKGSSREYREEQAHPEHRRSAEPQPAALNQSCLSAWHMGVSGNVMADECARYETALPASCAVTDLGKPIQHILSELTGVGSTMADRHRLGGTSKLLKFKKNKIRMLTGVFTEH